MTSHLSDFWSFMKEFRHKGVWAGRCKCIALNVITVTSSKGASSWHDSEELVLFIVICIFSLRITYHCSLQDEFYAIWFPINLILFILMWYSASNPKTNFSLTLTPNLLGKKAIVTSSLFLSFSVNKFIIRSIVSVSR